MIRLALIAHLSEVSGAGIALLEMARGLASDRFAPLLVLPGRGPLLDRALAAGVRVNVLENPETSFPAGIAGKARLATHRVQYMRKVAALLRSEPIDVAYVNTSATVFAGVAAWLARVPVVWHIHETIEKPSRSTRAKLRVIERISSALVYASASAEQSFPASGVALHLTAKNRVDLTACMAASLDEKSERELGLLPGQSLVIANGLFRRKGPDVFLRAAQIVADDDQFRSVRFVLVGAPPDKEMEYFDSLRRFVDETPSLQTRVSFVGLRSDIPALLKRSAAFVSASRNEALPIAIIEAMAAGTPVIATDVGDCRLLLENETLGEVVPSEDPPQLAQAMKRVLEDRAAALHKAKLAQDKVMREYAEKDFWRPLETLLEKVSAKR